MDLATQVLRWGHALGQHRYNLISARNPNASEAEILALWTEQTYRDSMEPTALARWCDMIRARG